VGEITALALSAGGMFGAYQAGVWKALANEIRPDLVVGASVGALNGWAIAGGCGGEELERYWLDERRRLGLAFPRSVWDGVLDSAALDRTVKELFEAFRPRIRYAVVATDLFKLRPRIFEGEEVSWQHLAASCAAPGCFEQRRIGGRIYSDGGLLSALPAWAARELGATRIIAVNALPRAPSVVIGMLAGGMRRISGFRPELSEAPGALRIEPREPLGSLTDMLRWNRSKIARWIAQGERDGGALKHLFSKCFERE